MLNISTPKYYISEPGAINSLGRVTKEIIEFNRVGRKEIPADRVKKVFIVASPTAWSKAGDSILTQLQAEGIEYKRADFSPVILNILQSHILRLLSFTTNKPLSWPK